MDKHCMANPSLAYGCFFFDGRGSLTEQQLHANLIRSLLLQFAHRGGKLSAPLEDLYKDCSDGKSHWRQPSIHALESVLQRTLEKFKGAYVIIDSLDECKERDALINWIQGLNSSMAGRIHILVTTRPEVDIMQRLQFVQHSQISIEEFIAHDIEAYLIHALQTDPNFHRFNTDTRALITTQLIQGAHGMYVILIYHGLRITET